MSDREDRGGKEKNESKTDFFSFSGDDLEAARWIQDGIRCLERREYLEALSFFEKATSKKYPRGWSFKLMMYANGLGVVPDKQEVQTLHEMLETEASAGNAIAQFGLGWIYHFGHGTGKNYKEAVRYYQLSANKGFPPALNNLALMYECARGVEKDDQEAARLYGLSAKQGHSPAQFFLGLLYEKGCGVPQDNQEAARLYRLSAEQGHPLAQNNLGVLYDNGLGVTKDVKESVELYRLSAKQGCATAQRNLGLMYENGYGVPQNHKEAARLYNLSAEQGDSAALNNLALMYDYGRGVSKDLKKAVNLYRVSAEQGSPVALCNLGLMYECGRGVAKNNEEAACLYRQSAQQGHSPAQNNLGLMYESGRGVEQSYEQALKLFRASAEQGYSPAQNNLGLMYKSGFGIEKDEKKAAKLFFSSHEQGSLIAPNNLGLMYENGEGMIRNFHEAVRLYRLSAEKGNPRGQISLGRCYHFGLGVAEDERKAVRLFKLSAKQGCPRGMNMLGLMYEEGLGVERDLQEAIRLFRLSAELGVPAALRNLGLMYATGRSVSKSDQEAIKLFRLGSERGCPQGQNCLGYMYENGRGITRNYQEAAQLYRLSAEQGDPGGQNNLGLMHEHGYGMPKNSEEAVRLFCLSAAKGNITALNNLGRLGGLWFQNDNAQFALGEIHMAVPQFFDPGKAITYFKKSLEKGNVFATTWSGLIYDLDFLSIASPKPAIHYYQEAAAKRCPMAQSALGVCHLRGLITGTIDETEADLLFQQSKCSFFEHQSEHDLQTYDRWLYILDSVAKNQVETNSQNSGRITPNLLLGMIFEKGLLGQRRDSDEALKYLQTAARLGDEWSQSQVGIQPDIDVDEVLAKAFFEEMPLVSREHTPENLMMCAKGIVYLTVPSILNYHNSYEHLKRASKRGCQLASCFLGLFYEYGLDDIVPCSVKAALYFYTKADKRFPLLKLILGVFYLREWKKTSCAAEIVASLFASANSPSPVYQNFSMATMLDFFAVLAKKKGSDYDNARILLAVVYQWGLVGVPQQPEKAARYFQQIYENGDAWTQYNIGMMYEMGKWGGKRNYSEAQRWYLEAANKNLQTAQSMLSALYRRGYLGQVDEQSAEYWRDRTDNPKEKHLPPYPLLPHLEQEVLPSPGLFQRAGSLFRSSENMSSSLELMECHIENVTKVLVLYDWVADRDDRLSIRQGEMLYVFFQEIDWWWCENQFHQEGKVPKNFVQIVSLPTKRQPNLDLSGKAKRISKSDLHEMKEIGRGGYGVVFQGTWENLVVAIKKPIDSDLNSQVRADFEWELGIMSKLRHPNIVMLYAYTHDTEVPYLVVEFMEGNSLWKRLGGRPANQRHCFLPEIVCYQIALNVASGLAYIHQMGALHRDLKSENIFLCHQQGNPYFAKIGDFGLAALNAASSGSAHTIRSDNLTPRGTIEWMAPELLREMPSETIQGVRAYSPRTDIYSLAIVFWELVVHEPPYQQFASTAEMMKFVQDGHRDDIPPRASEIFRDLIERGTSDNPTRRPPLSDIISLLREGLKYLEEEERDKMRKGKLGEKEEEEEEEEGGHSFSRIGSYSSSSQLQEIPQADSPSGNVSGPLSIPEFSLKLGGGENGACRDIQDCFFQAAALQMQLTRRNFLSEIEVLKGEQLSDHLCKLVQGEQCEETSIQETIYGLVERTISVVAIVDTRHPELGFRCYFTDRFGERKESLHPTYVPTRPIIRLAYTGAHYLSVEAHPVMGEGALRDGFHGEVYGYGSSASLQLGEILSGEIDPAGPPLPLPSFVRGESQSLPSPSDRRRFSFTSPERFASSAPK